MANKEQRKDEAIKRMKLLKMNSNVIREFNREDKLNLSEGVGHLYWLDEKQLKEVDKFEENHPDCTPFHVVRSFTNFGEMLAILFVSKHDEEWELDLEDLKEGYVLAYVVNLNAPDCSEMGSVVVKPSIGGLVRKF